MFKKLLCFLDSHSWVYLDVHERTYRTCQRCKIVEETTPWLYLWHRTYPGSFLYIRSATIIEHEESY